MTEETLLVILLLSAMAIMCVWLIRYQRGKEKRLAAQKETDLPVESTFRTVLVVLTSMTAGATLTTMVVTACVAPREHALAVVLFCLAGTGAGFWMGFRFSRRFRRIGVLRCTADALDLELGDERRHIDLNQPYELLGEGLAFGFGNMPLQVVEIAQDDRHWGFSYGIPLGRKHYGDRSLSTYITPVLSGEARIIHDRLRALKDKALVDNRKKRE